MQMLRQAAAAAVAWRTAVCRLPNAPASRQHNQQQQQLPLYVAAA
jgi:hypothetical protein